MEKDLIFGQRKEIKKKSHTIVKSHYFLLFILSLIMILFGTEYRLSGVGIGKLNYGKSYTGKAETDPDSPVQGTEGGSADTSASGMPVMAGYESRATIGSILEMGDLAGILWNWNKDLGLNTFDGLIEKIRGPLEEKIGDKVLGRTEGVLAGIINSASSGSIFSQLVQALASIVRSESLAVDLMVVFSLLLYFLVFTFLIHVYSAIMRQMFLEARTYENVPFSDVLRFAVLRKWKRASLTMIVQYIYQLLWSFTIVGGIIKDYSYMAVPYIVAENPSLKANETITLSRRMMDGHKLELLKFQLTMIGWFALGIVTFGISEIVYGVSYREACMAEFYFRVREDAIRRGVEGTEKLNNPYLFEKADRILLYETYFDVVDEITVIHENRIVLKGVRKKAAEWLAIWIGTLDEKKRYDDQEGKLASLEAYKLCMGGKAYPHWLDPLRQNKELRKPGTFSYMRHYSVYTLFLLFIVFSFIGFSWEVGLHFVQTGELANRGTLLGPWLPIYGSGGVFALIVCSRFRKNPVAEFFTSMVVCGILEYFSGWYLETKFHRRWWSYDGYFLNLHGRICAEGLLVFGIGCCLVVYLIAPVFDYLLAKVKKRILLIICAVLAISYGADQVHSFFAPNMSEGAVESGQVSADPRKSRGCEKRFFFHSPGFCH